MPPWTSKNRNVDGVGAGGLLHDRVSDVPTPREGVLWSFINRQSESKNGSIKAQETTFCLSVWQRFWGRVVLMPLTS